jgi:hypothetical protein
MRFFVFVCCALFVGSGCARIGPLDDVAPGDSLLLLNVTAGHYQSLLLETVGDSIDEHVELSIEKANPDPKWAPSSMVCVTAKSSSHEACLRITARKPGASEVTVIRLLFKDDKKTLLSQEPVPGNFTMGKPVRIALRSGPDTVEFKVDGGAWLKQALPFTPEAVRLNCSSALCKLRLGDSPSP